MVCSSHVQKKSLLQTAIDTVERFVPPDLREAVTVEEERSCDETRSACHGSEDSSR